MTTNVKPLVLDVDGTFLKTDILFECFWASLGKAPLRTLSSVFRNFGKPAALKRDLAAIADLRTDLLPVNPEISDLASKSIENGREVVLASASDEALIERLAADHGLSERVFASNGEHNLKGAAKAGALIEAYGDNGFDYAGNERVDVPIWEHAENALIVGDHPKISADLTAKGKTISQFSGGFRKRDLIRALRPHQWVKNVLLLLPMLAAHEFVLTTLLYVLLGIAAFSAAASTIYIVNDLLDLEADRLHATKHKRPFASGAVPIHIGMLTCVLLAAIAIGVGSFLGTAFLMVIIGYMILSLAYSLKFKRMRWVDIATLAALYTIRVVAGAAAGQVAASGFMLVFIFPVFVALGCVKRMTELTLADNDDPLPGRGYSRRDRGDLLNMSAIGVVGALVIYFLYTMSDQAVALYPSQWILWTAMLPIALWLIRMVRLGYFGKMDYDPIVFALRDKRGIGLALITLALMFTAAGLWRDWFSLN
jgi:4-hydroxybenzoate polyprenyltransferase/phosphoserine phosphatase